MQNESVLVPTQRLGRLPRKTTRKALMFSDFIKYLDLPKATNYWTKKTPLPLVSFGNTIYGNCTRAKQALAQMLMERIEVRRSPLITDEEVIRVYLDMTARLYGGGDTGAYEDDALNEWRRPETTFRDTKGHPYTIDAYLRINPSNQDEVKAGIALSAARGIAVCLNLPAAWMGETVRWALPPGQALVGPWMPGSWGGHSLWCYDYTHEGLIMPQTWKMSPILVTWDAVAAYMDEAHVVIDSVDSWRKKKSTAAAIDMPKVVDAVNSVSSYPIQDSK